MVTVGVLVRALSEGLDAVERRVLGLESVVETIALEEPGTFGVVIEGATLNAVHATLTEGVQRTPGVLAAWPLHTELQHTELGEGQRTSMDPEHSNEPQTRS